jgi:hypothetical protein
MNLGQRKRVNWVRNTEMGPIDRLEPGASYLTEESQ